jgi:hypothetical protein
MLNKVEFLLFKAIVYLHRKKRKNNIHNIWYVCLNVQIQEWFMVYPWAYLLTLKSNLRHCRLFSRKEEDDIIMFTTNFHRFIHPCEIIQRSKKIFRLEYILGGSSFSGERSCAHNVQEVGSQTPGRVVVRLSMCSNICSL